MEITAISFSPSYFANYLIRSSSLTFRLKNEIGVCGLFCMGTICILLQQIKNIIIRIDYQSLYQPAWFNKIEQIGKALKPQKKASRIDFKALPEENYDHNYYRLVIPAQYPSQSYQFYHKQAMGNDHTFIQKQPLSKNPLKVKDTELTDTESLQESVYEERQEESNCFGCIKYKKTTLKKVDWEYKFMRNCSEVQEFEWVRELVELVANYDLQRGKYFRQVNNLKKQKYMPRLSESDNKATEKEIETFKRNLKKSVIMSFGPNSKIFESAKMSTINVKKSRLEPHRNSRVNPNKSQILVQRCYSGLSSKDKTAQKSFIQFMDENEYSKQSNNDISKSTTHELQIFMRFSSILEIHLNDMSCILGRVKSQFIKLMLKKYGQNSKETTALSDFVDDITQFLIILKLGVMDYYNLSSFADNSINFLIANQENILSTCTSILFKDHQFYNLLFNTISNHFKEQEERFMRILDELKGSGPDKFSVKDKFCLNHRTLKTYLNQMSAESGENIVENVDILDQMETQVPFKRCMDYLKEVGKSRSPVNKMKSIVACSEGITKEIEAFYDRNGLKKEKWMLDADQVLSIFAYIIVAARVQHLHTQLFILDSFATGHQSINMTGYYTAVLNCAVQHLQNEFEHLVAKEAKVQNQ